MVTKGETAQGSEWGSAKRTNRFVTTFNKAPQRALALVRLPFSHGPSSYGSVVAATIFLEERSVFCADMRCAAVFGKSRQTVYRVTPLLFVNESICTGSTCYSNSFSATLCCPFRSFSHVTMPLLSRRIRGARRPRHREPAPGDWTCQCGEVNYRAKRECFKCGAPAPPLPPGMRRPTLPGEDPHDWACPCGQMNFRGNVLCHKCNQPKPEPPAAPGKEVTLWTCQKCKGINRSNRRYCFKCSAPSPLMQFRPIQ